MQSTILILFCIIAFSECKPADLPIMDEEEVECILESGVDREMSYNLSFIIESPIPDRYYDYLKCLYEKKEFIIDNSLESYYMSLNGQFLSSIDHELAAVINDCEDSSHDKSIVQMIYNFDACVGFGVVKYFASKFYLDDNAGKCINRVGITKNMAKVPSVLLKGPIPSVMYKYWDCLYSALGLFNDDGTIKYEVLQVHLAKRMSKNVTLLILNSCQVELGDSRGETAFKFERCLNMRIIKLMQHSNAVLLLFT